MYEMAGLQTVKSRWSLEETLLLFLIFRNQKKKYKLVTIVTEYNQTISVEDLSDLKLSNKTRNQITGKLKNLKQYMNIYDHTEEKGTPRAQRNVKKNVKSKQTKNK